MNEEEQNHEFPAGEPGAEEGQEGLGSARPAVAAAQGKVLVIALVAIAFIFFVVHSLFFGSKEEKLPVKRGPEKVVQAPKQPSSMESAEMFPPNVPPITSPNASMVPTVPNPPPPPPPPAMTPPPPPQVSMQQGPTNEQLKARIHSPMLASGSGRSLTTSKINEKKKNAGTDPNDAWAQSVEDSQTETVEATQVKNLGRTIVQGKLIEGVLETAIDSTLPGSVRAIVSHDTYAESGRSILIPKGSRIVGTYNSSVHRGQARVFIIWTRIIRPDGVDIAINSPGVDALGRAGMTGSVDNKYFESFTTAILTSSLDVGVAAIGDALFGNQQQSQTTGTAGTTTISSPTATAMQTAVQNIGSVGQAIVNSTVNLQPTIHIDQGEVIKIFVNKDVVFPSASGEVSFIP